MSLVCFGTDYDLSRPSNSATDSRALHQKRYLWQGTARVGRMRRIVWAWRLCCMLVVKRSTYDIVHVHAMTWGALLAPIICHRLGRKAVYTITRQGLDDPSTIASHCFGHLKLWLFKRYDAVIGLAPALVADCHRHKFPSELVTLPNFLLLSSLEGGRDRQRRALLRSELCIPTDAPAILFVGAGIQRKGLDILVETFLRLVRENPSLRLIIVGPMEARRSFKIAEDYVCCQRQKLTKAGLDNRVVWAGLVADEVRLADFYHASDLFVLPTRSEGSPNVIPEAMAAELPVVTTRLNGITDMLVAPGVTGFLVELDDVDGFVSAAKVLIGDPALRCRMGTAARRACLERYGFPQYTEKLEGLYRRIV